MAENQNKLVLILAFIAIYFVWGTTYLANLFGLESIPPFILSCMRYLSAGLILLFWVFLRKLQWPDKRTILILSVTGILMLVGGSGLVVYAEQYINSGYAAVILATEPMWFVILDKSMWRRYFSDTKIISGLIVGFAGIALFSHFSPAGPTAAAADKITGTLIVLLSAVLWVAGTLYMSHKVKRSNSNLVNTTIQLLAAGLFCSIIAVVNHEWTGFSVGTVSLRAWGGLAYLIIFGSLVAYLAYNWLVRVQPPAIVSTHTYINPIVAVCIGWLLADEQIVWTQVIALVIVLAGVVLTQTSKAEILTKDR